MVLKRTDDNPYLIMLIGIAGSGKSTLAEQILIDKNGYLHPPVICSSDTTRLNLFGSMDVQENNEDVFREMSKQIKENLINGVDVVYDATNLNKRKRAAFLDSVQKIDCHKEAVCVLTPFRDCVTANKSRDRVVPYHKQKKMYMDWTPPSLAEGFDHITLAYHWGTRKNDFSIQRLFDRIDDMDQENDHHSLTLGSHCKQAASYILERYPEEEMLAIATLLHDNGKVFSKTNINAKGVDDGQAHYYQHHCVGAYDSLFYTANMDLDVQDRLYISQLIYYHMHPYMQWEQSEKSLKRDLRIMPTGLYEDVQKLHDADVAAHIPDHERYHPGIDAILHKDTTRGEIYNDFIIER